VLGVGVEVGVARWRAVDADVVAGARQQPGKPVADGGDRFVVAVLDVGEVGAGVRDGLRDVAVPDRGPGVSGEQGPARSAASAWPAAAVRLLAWSVPGTCPASRKT
jgi:hypothetical protein